MVSRLIRTLTSPVRGLHEAAYVLAGLTLASQLLALLRDRLFAHQFGASEMLDLYYAAFKVPDFVFALVASLVSAYVLIPRIAGANKEDARKLLSDATSFLLISGGVITLIIALFAPDFLFALYPSFRHSAHAGEFVLLARILLLQPILLGLSSVAMAVTQVERRFTLFALSPVLYNLGIIAGMLLLYPRFGLPGIGVGVVVGALVHLGIQLPVVAKAGVFPHLSIPSWQRIWSIMKDSVPRSFALGMGSATTLGLTSLASYAGPGAISVFTLAGNLEAVPLSLIGASYATAAFPVLAEHANANKTLEFKATLTQAGRHIIFWSSVLAALTIVLRAHIVRVILGSGAFDWNATRLTAAVLAVLVIGLIAQGMVLLASRAFYAMHRSWNPLVIQIAGFLVSIGSAFAMLHVAAESAFVRDFTEALLRVPDLPDTGILFIAIGATAGQLVMLIAAYLTLGTVAPGVARSLIRPLFEGLAAGTLGASAAYGVLAGLGNLAPLTTLAAVFTQGFLAGVAGLIVAGIILALLENEEMRGLLRAFGRVRARFLPPQSEF